MLTTPPDRPETWLSVPGYEGQYEVSDLGRVRSVPRLVTSNRPGHPRSVRRARVLATDSTAKYLRVTLCRDGRPDRRSVHRLVLEAFAGQAQPGQQARHGLGGRHDNRWPENLCWGTKAENEADKLLAGTLLRGERVGTAKLTLAAVHDIRRRWQAGETRKALAAEYGVTATTIGNAVRGQTFGLGPLDTLPRLWGNRGERAGHAKLTWAIVDDCRTRYAAGEKARVLAREYHVSPVTMDALLKGRTWAAAAA